MGFTVRPCTTDDVEAVRDVCFATGFMGDPVAGQFADRAAFAHLFADWYLLNRTDTCRVLDDGTGHVGGYLLGSPDGPTGTDAPSREWFTFGRPDTGGSRHIGLAAA